MPLSVFMMTDLNNVPDLPVRSMVTPISPFAPACTSQGVSGNWTVVQLHEPTPLRMAIGSGEMLVKAKVNLAASWPLVASALFSTASQAITPSGNRGLVCEFSPELSRTYRGGEVTEFVGCPGVASALDHNHATPIEASSALNRGMVSGFTLFSPVWFQPIWPAAARETEWSRSNRRPGTRFGSRPGDRPVRLRTQA